MMKIVVDLRNSYSRDGVHEVPDYESALEIAKRYVSEKSEAGISGYADIRWYDVYKGESWLNSEITIQSKPSGKLNHLGYSIPEKEGMVKRLYVCINKGCNRVEHLFEELDMEEA